MKLNEIKKTPDGTYVGVKISKESKDKLYEMAEKLGVPNILPKKDYHITVIYSRKYLPNFEALGKLDEPIIAKPDKFSLFDAKDDNKCLVIELKCPDIVKRHNHIMKVHGATYDWDEYKCHITLSYDVEDFSLKGKSAKKMIDSIEIIEEYSENLNLNWLVN